jgi:hypothetical protein
MFVSICGKQTASGWSLDDLLNYTTCSALTAVRRYGHCCNMLCQLTWLLGLDILLLLHRQLRSVQLSARTCPRFSNNSRPNYTGDEPDSFEPQEVKWGVCCLVQRRPLTGMMSTCSSIGRLLQWRAACYRPAAHAQRRALLHICSAGLQYCATSSTQRAPVPCHCIREYRVRISSRLFWLSCSVVLLMTPADSR